METVKNAINSVSEGVASAAQSAKDALTGVQERVRADAAVAAVLNLKQHV